MTSGASCAPASLCCATPPANCTSSSPKQAQWISLRWRKSRSSVLRGADGLPSDAALAVADGIHHLLVDEFQDTSRRQHRLLASLVAAWPDPAGRTVFVVGDPMQSIYFFRDADAELFPRVRHSVLRLLDQETLPLDFVPLAANFRTEPALVRG